MTHADNGIRAGSTVDLDLDRRNIIRAAKAFIVERRAEAISFTPKACGLFLHHRYPSAGMILCEAESLPSGGDSGELVAEIVEIVRVDAQL